MNAAFAFSSRRAATLREASSRASDTFKRAAVFGVALCTVDQLGRRLCDHYFWSFDEETQKHVRDVLRVERQPRTQTRFDSGITRAWADCAVLEQLATLLSTEQRWERRGRIGGEQGLCDAVAAEVGFSVKCAPSLYTDGGDGVFAVGNIPAGRVLTVYAGTRVGVWDSLVYRMLQILLPWRRDNGYMVRQADSSVVDGNVCTANRQRDRQGYVSPSACGQLLNHPRLGTRANAAFMSVYVTPSDAFARLPVDSLWGQFSGAPHVITVLVSLTCIEDGDELLADYEFDGAEEDMPNWYSACDPQSTRRVWHGPSFRDYMDQEECR